MPTYHEGDKKVRIESWGSHVDKMIREAQARGDFDNVPGMGKPLKLDDDNPFNSEWSAAFRVAKNAGAAPLWIQLDKEIGADTEALQTMLERTARYLEAEAARIAEHEATQAAEAASAPAPAVAGQAQLPLPGAQGRRWWPFRRGASPMPARSADEATAAASSLPHTLATLEAERLRARRLYLDKAAELDAKIQEYNSYRPRNLTWLEKPRLLPEHATRRFDERCPPTSRQ
jgi:hypothetical protein